MRAVLALIVPALLVAFAAPVLADNGKGRGKGHGHGHRKGGAPLVVVAPGGFVIPDRDRVLINRYYRTPVSLDRCPPGLAKKGNGCLPPGQAKKLWAVGRPLPPAVVYQPVPPPLVQQLAPAPDGYGYVRVDDDVLLMELTSRMVADVVSDFSASDDLYGYGE